MTRLNTSLAVSICLVACAALSIRATERATLLCFPLDNRTRFSSLSWIGDAVCEAIAGQIRLPEIEIVGRETRLALLEDADLPANVALSRASMIRLGQLAGADRLAFGSFSGNENALRIVLEVLDLKAMKLGAEIVSAGPARSLPELENELAWQVLVRSGFQGASSREAFRERTRRVPNSAYSFFIRSLGASELQSQIDLLLKAEERYADFTEAHYRLGRYYFDKGDCSKAIPRLARIQRDFEFFQKTRSMLGTCYCRQGNSVQAIQAYLELLPYDPPMEVLNNLGVAYLREGDLPLAVQNLKQASAQAGSLSVVAMNLAILRHVQGDHAAALVLVDECLRMNPNHALLQYLRSRVLMALEKEQESAEALARAVRLGIDPQKLKNEDPRKWTQFILH